MWLLGKKKGGGGKTLLRVQKGPTPSGAGCLALWKSHCSWDRVKGCMPVLSRASVFGAQGLWWAAAATHCRNDSCTPTQETGGLPGAVKWPWPVLLWFWHWKQIFCARPEQSVILISRANVSPCIWYRCCKSICGQQFCLPIAHFPAGESVIQFFSLRVPQDGRTETRDAWKPILSRESLPGLPSVS